MNPFTGISSVTTMRGEDGELKTVETNEWVRENYRVNMQDDDVETQEEGAKAPSMKRARKKPPGVAKAKPKMVGEELVEKAHKNDLKRRGLD